MPSKPSNLNRVFHALKQHQQRHGLRMSRRALKAFAVIVARNAPNFHRFTGGVVDTAPWLD